MKFLRSLISKKSSGQGLVEYGLIIGLLIVIIIAAYVALKPKIAQMAKKGAPPQVQVPSGR